MCHRMPWSPGHLAGDALQWDRSGRHNRALSLESRPLAVRVESWRVPVTVCLGCSILRPRRSSSGPLDPAPVRPCEATITPRKYSVQVDTCAGDVGQSPPKLSSKRRAYLGGITTRLLWLFSPGDRTTRDRGFWTAFCVSLDLHDRDHGS